MKVKALLPFVAIAFAVAAALENRCRAGYTFVDLSNSSISDAVAVRASGSYQVGSGMGASTGNLNHALLWQGNGATMVDLHPIGFTESSVYAATATQQGGAVFAGATAHAALWSGTANSFMDLNPSFTASSQIIGISGSQQVGTVFVGNYHAYLWNGAPTGGVDLNPQGATSSFAVDISNGIVVGYINTSSQHAFLWNTITSSTVDLHPANSFSSKALAIRGNEQVGLMMAGVANMSIMHAALWHGDSNVIDLQPLDKTYTRSEAKDTNGAQEVGVVYFTVGGNANNTHAAVWSGSAASFVDLHAYVPATYNLSSAWGIDEFGDIVGYVRNGTGGRVPAMWIPTPVPEPRTLLMVVTVGVALLCRRPLPSVPASPHTLQ